MNRKLILTLLSAVTFFCFTINAQEAPFPKGPGRKFPAKEKFNPREMVENQGRQMCFELNLDEDRSVQFMEIYRSWCSSLHEILGDRPKKIENPDDEETEKMIFKDFEISQRILELRKEYYNNFRQVLSPREIQKMYFIEKNKAQHFGPKPPKRENGELPD